MQRTIETTNAVDVASVLSDFVNSSGTGQQRIAEFVKAVTNDHRTLQQSMFRVMLACIKEWSGKQDFEFDARNANTIEICRKINETLDGCDVLRYI